MNRSVERILAVVGASAVLVVGVDAVSYAATGSGVLLGHSNTAKKTTTIKNSGSGSVLNLVTKKSSSAPFTTNAKGQVANLNASDLDGQTASQIQSQAVTQAVGQAAGQIHAHWALVSRFGVVSDSSGGVSVTTPSTGIYCIAVAGVSALTTVATVTPDFAADDTDVSSSEASQAIVEIDSGGGGCAIGDFAVFTFQSIVTPGSTGSASISHAYEPFAFSVPR